MNDKNKQVQIKVIKAKCRGYGYCLQHNQQPGFKGIITRVWGWYRYKKEASDAAKELMKCWNC